MRKRFILLLGLFLVSRVPAAAQTPDPQIVPARDRIAALVTVLPTAPAPLFAASLLPPEYPGKSAAHFGYPFAGTYERDQGLQGLQGLVSLSPVREVKTLCLTQSLLPLVQFWGGRLRLDGFTSRLHMQNMQLGASAAGGLQDFRLPRQSYPGGPRSVNLYGISLSFHFGRDAQIGRPIQIWQRLARIRAAVQ
jgi:hypothetical protein